MSKNLIVISLIVVISIVCVGCAPFVSMPIDTNNSGIGENINASEENDVPNKAENKTARVLKTQVEYVSKEIEATPESELVSEDVAIENAKKDANKYMSIEKNPVVTMVIKDKGTVKMELYPTIAPESVENFISLINKKFYDGLSYHRVIPGFMAQGGDPEGTGSGGPNYTIVGEFSDNGIKNNLSHERGILSMARSDASNSASSQFFIVTDDSVFLDGKYAAFGKVLEGMDIVDEIVNSEVYITESEIDTSLILTEEDYYNILSKMDRPINPPIIEKMTVETFGVEYDEPEKIKEKTLEELIEEYNKKLEAEMSGNVEN